MKSSWILDSDIAQLPLPCPCCGSKQGTRRVFCIPIPQNPSDEQANTVRDAIAKVADAYRK